jgi:KipI family sensor histidine kinase inhibitor
VDLDEVARIHGLTTNEVIRLHKESNFQVYMVGFAPGWCYLGGLNPMLHTPRLDSPRLQVPAGCISIGGQQGMIGALPMPSGWRLLGQTPVKSYVPDRDPPFIISAGDLIEFYQINAAEYERMQQAAERGELIAQDITNNQ